MVKSISEIIQTVRDLKTREEKVAYLKANETDTLKFLLQLLYDKKRFKFLIPDTDPPYIPSEHFENHGAMYNQARKLKYVIHGMGGENLLKSKRESVFIEILESVHRDDAKFLLDVIKQKPLKGITIAQIRLAFGDGIIVPQDGEVPDEEDLPVKVKKEV